MASTDATAIPVKNQAYRVTFPIWDADGDLVTGATGLDSEISKDGGTFTDCTNEATEIATSSGVYFLDLSSTEMNADTVAIIVKTSTVGAKTTPIILYPQEAGDINVDVTYWNGTAVASPDTAGYPKVTVKSGTGTGELNVASGVVDADVREIAGSSVSTSTAQIGVNVVNFGGSAGTFASGRPEVNTTHWKGTAAATVDTAGYPVVTVKDGTGAGEIGLTSGAIDTVSAVTTVNGLAADVITSAALAASAVTEIQSGLSTLDAAGVRSAVGLASANLDTQLTAIDDFLDTEIAAIKAKTDNLPTDPADQSAVEAAITSATSPLATASALATVSGLVDDLEGRLTSTRAGYLDNLSGGAVALASGVTLTNAGIDAILDRTDGVEVGYTLRQALRLVASALLGELSGAATTTIVIRDIGDTKTRITATVDADGNRSAVTYDVS